MGETVTGYASGFFASGKGGNQAAMCARLGARVSMLGKVGDDARGQFLLDSMRENGVNVDGVAISAEHPTGTDCVLVAKDGSNAIVVAPNANAAVTDAEVNAMRPFFAEAQVALFQLQINRDAVERAMRLARDCGCKVVLNPAPACEVPDELLALADCVTPNETEAEFFTGVYREGMDLADWRTAAAGALHARGVRTLIITIGEHGAYYSGPDGAFMMPAFRIEPVDSTAAGDAFNGGLGVRLAAGDCAPRRAHRHRHQRHHPARAHISHPAGAAGRALCRRRAPGDRHAGVRPGQPSSAHPRGAAEAGRGARLSRDPLRGFRSR